MIELFPSDRIGRESMKTENDESGNAKTKCLRCGHVGKLKDFVDQDAGIVCPICSGDDYEFI